MVFKVKICGVTREIDVRSVKEAGADAIGLNLVSRSPRYLALSRASELARACREYDLSVVIVLMNPSEAELEQAIQIVSPDYVQLHGSETPQLGQICGSLPIVKALTWTGKTNEKEMARSWKNATNTNLAGFLVDAFAPGIGGGSGKTADWSLLNPRPEELNGVPLLLAGGLTDRNVKLAVEATGCDGVDTASGVESSPGIKDDELVRRFVQAAHVAWHPKG